MNAKILLFVLLASASTLAAAAESAAEVVLVTGRVTAQGAAGARSLSSGDAVNAGDTLSVGPNSYANLRFADGGRVLLRPNTEFTVEAYTYKAAPLATPGAAPAPAAGSGQAFFRLVRGGFRAISGLIGKVDPQSYRVTTPVATIGIRGTDYEVQTCTDDCPEDDDLKKAGDEPVLVASSDLAGVQLAQAGGDRSGGVLVATNEGTIVMQTGRGEFMVKVGEVAYALANGQVFMLPVVPDALLLNPTPSPEKCQ